MLRTAIARVGEDAPGAAVAFAVGQAEHPPFADGGFDALTFTYLMRYVDAPGTTLRRLVQLVRPGGTIASLEFGVPSRPWFPGWWLYTRAALPLIGRLVSPAWSRVGRFLGPNISGHLRRFPLQAQVEMWRAAGVDPVHVRRMTFGSANVIWGTRAR
jgi:demethylmenaquinone methyltransferase/2-methoxy-6-polyprenyl-1,4-benzoquinol methylase